MRRRALLATLAAGSALFAGCGSTPTSETDAAATGTDTPTTAPGTPAELVEFDDDRSGTSIVDLETADRTYALSPVRYRTEDDIEVRMRFDRTATAEHPARLVASVRNADEYPEEVDLRWLPPFGDLTSEPPRDVAEPRVSAGLRDEGSLVLAPTGGHDLVDDPPAVERDDGRWRLADEIGRWLPETLTLDPNEAVRGEYAVAGHPDGSGRPTGVYDFVRRQGDPVRISVWVTGSPGPEAESRFAGESVPSLPGDREATWFHEADESTGAYVRPSTERANLPASVTFQFVNHTRESLGCGHWYVYKLHDGEWFDLGPYARTAECRIVPAAGTKPWTLHAYRGGGELPPEAGRAYPHLGGGRYAIATGYGADAWGSAALVELSGAPIEITPTAGVEAERADGTVTVTSPRWSAGADDAATLTLTRADSAAETLVREQVMRRRYRGLRNTLPFVEAGVEAVVLRTGEHVAQQLVGYESQTRRFRIDGRAYELTVSGDA